jgi:hypothetical protein
MGRSGRCIGAVDEETGLSYRLLNSDGSKLSANVPYRVGQVWNIECRDPDTIEAPHIEDVCVTSYTRREALPPAELRSRLLALESRIPDRFWRGSIRLLFGGAIRWTGNDRGYIDSSVIPAVSTGFWIPKRDLIREDNGRAFRYRRLVNSRVLSHVGETDIPADIPAGSLTRVSLARWWRPDGAQNVPLRCYLQLSGVY